MYLNFKEKTKGNEKRVLFYFYKLRPKFRASMKGDQRELC